MRRSSVEMKNDVLLKCHRRYPGIARPSESVYAGQDGKAQLSAPAQLGVQATEPGWPTSQDSVKVMFLEQGNTLISQKPTR